LKVTLIDLNLKWLVLYDAVVGQLYPENHHVDTFVITVLSLHTDLPVIIVLANKLCQASIIDLYLLSSNHFKDTVLTRSTDVIPGTIS